MWDPWNLIRVSCPRKEGDYLLTQGQISIPTGLKETLPPTIINCQKCFMGHFPNHDEVFLNPIMYRFVQWPWRQCLYECSSHVASRRHPSSPPLSHALSLALVLALSPPFYDAPWFLEEMWQLLHLGLNTPWSLILSTWSSYENIDCSVSF